MILALLTIFAAFFWLALALFWMVNILMAAAKKLRGTALQIIYIILLASASATLSVWLFTLGLPQLIAA